jgi:hypothetical protein
MCRPEPSFVLLELTLRFQCQSNLVSLGTIHLHTCLFCILHDHAFLFALNLNSSEGPAPPLFPLRSHPLLRWAGSYTRVQRRGDGSVYEAHSFHFFAVPAFTACATCSCCSGVIFRNSGIRLAAALTCDARTIRFRYILFLQVLNRLW